VTNNVDEAAVVPADGIRLGPIGCWPREGSQAFVFVGSIASEHERATSTTSFSGSPLTSRPVVIRAVFLAPVALRSQTVLPREGFPALNAR
jgi:hypothetical protein